MHACLDFGGSTVKLATAGRGALVETAELPLRGGPADLERAAAIVRRMAGGAPIDLAALALPGLIDADRHRLAEAHGKYEWMLEVDLDAWSRASFGAPARLEIDARAALVGEVADGCARGERDVVVMVLGTGIGTAAMLDGVPIRGARGTASVLGGHVTIDRAGPRCNCGNLGCAEVFGGSWALPDRIREHRARGIGGTVDGSGGFEGLIAAAAEGDPLAQVVLDEAIGAWGACAVTLCHLFDPSAIVLAGGVAHAAGTIVPPLERYLDAHLWATMPRPRLLISTDPRRSVLRGLAALAAELEP